MYGLSDNQFMNGVPYYHIKAYYDYIGSDAPLYVCFTSDGKNWSAIPSMQSQAGGKIFQIGVWTAQCIWNVSGDYLGFTDLCSSLEMAAEELAGKPEQVTMGSSPLSIIVSPNTAVSKTGVTLQDIPNAIELNLPKMSVCLVQNGSENVKSMQGKNPLSAPVGCIGVLMACLYLAYAEECIGYVDKFNLNKNDDFEDVGVCFGGVDYSVDEISYVVGNQMALNGYIVPCTYSGKEAEVFFSGDPTLSDGDYNAISNNRIIHKCKRCIHSALLPYINGNHLLDTANGGLSETVKSVLTSAIANTLDSLMVNKMAQSQINGRTVEVSESENILQDDAISISLSIGLVSYNKVINEEDDYIV